MNNEKLRFKSDNLRFNYINKFLKGNKILDLASSEGYVHELLNKANPEKKFYTCDFENSDFNRDLNKPFNIRDKFDTIVAGEIIEHLENPTKFIDECKKILVSRGRLIITTPNAAGFQYIKNPSWCIENYDKPEHIAAFTIPMVKGLLIKANFDFVHSDYINAFWVHNPLKIIPKIFKRLRTDLIIVADKN